MPVAGSPGVAGILLSAPAVPLSAHPVVLATTPKEVWTAVFVVGVPMGAIIGAIAGAIVGAIVGAVVGAVVGAIAGAIVGAIVGAVVGAIVAWPAATAVAAREISVELSSC